jgi:hypothetical protein
LTVGRKDTLVLNLADQKGVQRGQLLAGWSVGRTDTLGWLSVGNSGRMMGGQKDVPSAANWVAMLGGHLAANLGNLSAQS